ncbi:phytase [Sphingomonas sp. RS6]
MRASVTAAALMLALQGCAAPGGAGPGNAGRAAVMLPAVDVYATGETAPVGTGNADAADDPAIWRNPADPAASLILGTDKKAGLYVYGLDGVVRDFAPAGALNNVDLRDVTRADGGSMILVGASDRTDRAKPRIALFVLDGRMGKLTPLGSDLFLPASHAPAEAYGFCMGAARSPGELARAFVIMKDGEVAEARLVEQGGAIRPVYLRSMKLGTQSEGCVVDDATGMLYVAEEDVAIWRFALDDAQPAAERFASVGAKDGLVDDIEGLAVAGDMLVASSQGDNAYAVFDKASGALRGRFRIADGAIGGTSDTDGIELMLGDFGPRFPRGLFVAQDGNNAPRAQNFKLVGWDAIESALAAQ